MVKYVVYFFSALVSEFVGIEWCSLLFQKKSGVKSHKIVLILAVMYFITTCVISSMESNLLVYSILSVLQFLVEYALIARYFVGKKLKKAAYLFMYQLIVPSAILFLLSGWQTYADAVRKGLGSKNSAYGYFDCMDNFTLCVFMYIIFLVIGEIKRRRKYKISTLYIIPFLILGCIQLGIQYYFEIILINRISKENTFVYLLICSVFIIIFLCLCTIYKKYIDDMEHSRVTEEHLNYYKLQQQHFQDTEERMRELKSVRHDFKKHMIVLRSLSRERKQEELDAYISNLDTNITLSTEIIDGKNSVVSAQLTHIKELCRKNDISFEYVLQYKEIYMDPFDLNTILGNVLDNAYEASLKVEDRGSRYIRIMIQQDAVKSSMTMITCVNYFSDTINQREGTLVTSKEDKLNHGLGIMKIEETAKKYEGRVDIHTSGQEFLVNVVFRNEFHTNKVLLNK